MYINSVKIKNFRCLGNVSIDELSPITVLVGRNNTGKSAFLEAIALASTAEAGWVDALGTDVLNVILKKRGGISQASMMVKMDYYKATVEVKGEQIDGTLEVFVNMKDIPDDMVEILTNYLDDHANSYLERVFDYLTVRERAKGPDIERLINREDEIKSIFRRLIIEGEAYFFYNNKLRESRNFAMVIKEERLRTLESRLERELGVLLLRYLPPLRLGLEEIIRSGPITQSKTVFMLEASTEYLKKLQRDLLKSGELITLIDSIRERIKYFRDIRETDGDFYIYLKPFKKPVPLSSMGDGFRAKLAMLSIILMTHGGIILMEEPEMRLHPGFMEAVIEQITSSAAKKEGQFIISTHSLEFLRYLLKKNAEIVKVICMRLIEKTGEIDYITYNGEEALKHVEELESDLRGP